MRKLVNNMMCSITREMTTVHNSFLMEKEEVGDLITELLCERGRKRYPITRSHKSYARELIAHNRMYKMHLFRGHTRDSDLEENIKLWKEIIYWMFGW